ncbi:hypothetical protein ACFMPD_08490 [Sedimentitalea sp. HM32M-2]|uniref:hypothetical protein n=1 Tax=Sedimentitalea sp. HM32M-2 TaxID=3351566 RepID=UPI003631C940
MPEKAGFHWRDAVDMALRHAEVATKLVQFFLLASIAVGGWMVASDDLRAAERFSTNRIVFAVIYTMLAMPVWFALLDLQKRINACYAAARQSVPAVSRDLANDFRPQLVTIGFPVFVIVIDLIILAIR